MMLPPYARTTRLPMIDAPMETAPIASGYRMACRWVDWRYTVPMKEQEAQ